MKMMRALIRSDTGFTIIEIIVVMVLVAILASIFAETITSSMTIYSDQIQRKDTHTDVRRSFDFVTHSFREWTSWQGSPTGTLIDFYRYSRFQDNNSNIYYGPLREAYSISQQALRYQRDDGEWANYYSLVSTGISPSPVLFTTSTLGGKVRLVVNMTVTQNDMPYKMAVTIFPRSQGG